MSTTPVQTNLFNKALLPKVDLLSAKRMPIFAVSLLCVMGVVAASSFLRESSKSSELAQLEESVEALRNKKISDFPLSVRKKKELTDKINAVEKQIKESREMLAGMGQAVEGEKNTSSATVMRALSSVDGQAVWLDAIDYSVGGQVLSLRGHSTDPKAIAPYIESLRKQPGMKRISMGQIDVTAEESAVKLWKFSISSNNQGALSK
jgi:Tfp pilus assembly protein PilN